MDNQKNKAQKRKKIWITILIGASIAIIVIIITIAYLTTAKLTTSVTPTKEKVYGECRSILPLPIIDSNYVKIVVSLKGKFLALREFEWNDTDYVSSPGCFHPSQDQSEQTLSNFMYREKNDTIVPFYALIRTSSNDNDYEFSLKVYNLNNQLIGQYPANAESLKAKIEFIGTPATLRDEIKLKIP